MMISVLSIFANIRMIIDDINMWHIDQIAHVSHHVFSIFIFWYVTECHNHLSMTEMDGKKKPIHNLFRECSTLSTDANKD